MVTTILLDDARWAGVPEERRQEWRLAIRELLDDHLFRLDEGPVVLRLDWTEEQVTLTWESMSRGVVCTATLARATVEPLVNEYVEVCRRMVALEAQQASVSEVTQLDQAKRDVHDRAAREIQRQLDAAGPTHDTARRIFTLLVVLFIDTTRLSVLRRPHGEGVVARFAGGE